MEDVLSFASPHLRTPVAAPALWATTCALTACPVRVRITVLHANKEALLTVSVWNYLYFKNQKKMTLI